MTDLSNGIGQLRIRRPGTTQRAILMKSFSDQTWKYGLSWNQEQHWVSLSSYLLCHFKEPCWSLQLVFDNWRMLHGRSAFTGKRRMCGGYSKPPPGTIHTFLLPTKPFIPGVIRSLTQPISLSLNSILIIVAQLIAMTSFLDIAYSDSAANHYSISLGARSSPGGIHITTCEGILCLGRYFHCIWFMEKVGIYLESSGLSGK